MGVRSFPRFARSVVHTPRSLSLIRYAVDVFARDMEQLKVDSESLAQLTYVRKVPADERQVFVLPFYVPTEGFYLAIPNAAQQLIVGRIDGLVDGLYVSIEPADDTKDILFPLGTLIARHLSLPQLWEPYIKIQNDLLNITASFEEYFILTQRCQTTQDTGYQTLFASEYEHLIVNGRAFYDQLQFLWRALWTKIIQDNRQELPKSFNDIAGLNATELRKRYNLPQPFIDFVLGAAPAFELLRGLRVGIEHSGHGAKSFYLFDNGLGVDVRRLPWHRFPIWSDHELRPNAIGCYLALNAWVGNEMLKAAAAFERAIAQAIPLPEAVTDWNVFLRSPFCAHLKRLEDYYHRPWNAKPLSS
jgi:hypothetical protein